jgi:hypothetical protein
MIFTYLPFVSIAAHPTESRIVGSSFLLRCLLCGVTTSSGLLQDFSEDAELVISYSFYGGLQLVKTAFCFNHVDSLSDLLVVLVARALFIVLSDFNCIIIVAIRAKLYARR